MILLTRYLIQFAGGMLILMGTNAGAAAFMSYHYEFQYSPSYDSYKMAVTLSIIEALTFIASLFYANILKSGTKYDIESSTTASSNAPINK